MRRTIVLSGILLAVIVTAVRVARAPLLASPESFLFGSTIGSPLEAFLYVTLLLCILYGLAALFVQRHGLADESLLLLGATPASITAIVLMDSSLILGIIFLLGALLIDQDEAVTVLALLALLINEAAIILAAIGVIRLLIRKRVTLASFVFVGTITAALLRLPHMTTEIFSELGATGMASIFITLLALTGMFLWWRNKTYPYLLTGLVLITAGLFIPGLRIVAAIASAALAGHALQVFSEREWRLESIRTISIFLIICGLIFTVADTSAQAVRAEPDGQFLDAVVFLQNIPTGLVFTSHEYEDALRWYGIPVSDANRDEVLSSRDIDVVKPLLPEYLLLTRHDDMENLWFLIENTDDFSLVKQGKYSVWRVER